MSESATVRSLLRVIERQQQTITDLNNRLMLLAGHPWTLPPLPENTHVPEEWQPPDWTATPEQEPAY